jgi:hypothetical protein
MSSKQLAVNSQIDVDGLDIGTVLFPALDGSDCGMQEPHIVIYANSSTDRIFAMNMEKDVMPKEFSYEETLSSIDEKCLLKGRVELPEYMQIPESWVSEKQKEKRDEIFNRIKPIVGNLEDFVLGSYGKGFIKNAMNYGGKKRSKGQVYRDLWAYFRSGCNINIFLRTPGTGKTTNRNYVAKPGPNSGTGHVVTKTDIKNIIKAIRAFYKKSNPTMYLEGVYQKCLDHYYSDHVFNIEKRRTKYERWNDDRLITEWQFMKVAREFRKKNKSKIEKAQGIEAEVAKNEKPSEGTIHDFYDKGIGYYYQIDETPFDVELVCQFDPTRKKRIGKPTVYVVRDMSSRAFVGLYITLKNPSADTARAVIFNAFRNKQQFCKELGIEIGSDDWFKGGKSRNIFCDNAEMKAELARCFSKDALITVHFNKEGHSQDKGLVERAFRLLHDAVKGQVDGYSPNNVPAHIKKILRNKALLNINELYQILITYIIIYNNHSVNHDIQLTKEMYMDGVKQIPRHVWDWDKRNRAGYLKHVEEFELYESLLEVGEVTCLPTHLSLKGFKLKYKCSWTKDNEYQVKGGKSPRLKCRYMRHSMDTIFIETPQGFKVATMIGKLFRQVSVEEIEAEEKIINEENIRLTKEHKAKQGETRALIEDLQRDAREEQEKINVNQANTQPIKQNRHAQLSHETEQDKVKHSEYLVHRYGLEAVSDNEVIKSQGETKKVSSTSEKRADRIRERRQQKQNKGNKDDS